jgi:hypothetical protein
MPNHGQAESADAERSLRSLLLLPTHCDDNDDSTVTTFQIMLRPATATLGLSTGTAAHSHIFGELHFVESFNPQEYIRVLLLCHV